MENKDIKYCPVCQQNNEITQLRLYQISFTKATYFCQKFGCVYPVGYGWTFVDRPCEELAGSQSESEESEDLSSDEEIIRPVFSTINILDHDLEYSIKLFEESDNGFIKIKKEKKIEAKKVVNVKTISNDKLLDSALDFLEDINFSEENIKPIEQNNHKTAFEIQDSKTLNSFEDQRTDTDINDEFTTDFLNSLIGHTENNDCNENDQLNVSLTDFDMFDISDSIKNNTDEAIIASNENNQQNSEESNLTKENYGKNEFLENNLSNKVIDETDEQVICTENKVENKLDERVDSCLVKEDNYNIEEMELIETKCDEICTKEKAIESTDTIKNTIPVLAPYKISNRTNITQEVKIKSDIQILDIVNIPIIFEGSPEAENILNMKITDSTNSVKIIDSTNSVNKIVNPNFNSIENEVSSMTSYNSAENIEISEKINNVDKIVHCIENNGTYKINDLTVRDKLCNVSENTSDNCDDVTEALLNASVKTLQLRNKKASLEMIKSHDTRNETIFDSIESNKDKTIESKLQTSTLATPSSNAKRNLKCFQLKDIKEKGLLYSQDLKKIDKFADNSACYIISNPNEIPKELENAKLIHITRLRKMPPIMLALDSKEKTRKTCPILKQCSKKKTTQKSETKVSSVEMKLDSIEVGMKLDPNEIEMKSNFNCLNKKHSKDVDETNSSSTDFETDEEEPKNLKTRKTHKNQNQVFKRAKAVKFDNLNADMKKNIDFLKSITQSIKNRK